LTNKFLICFKPTFANSSTTDKPTISFATPSKISFTPPVQSEQPAGNDDNEDGRLEIICRIRFHLCCFSEASEPPEPEKVEHESDAKYTYR